MQTRQYYRLYATKRRELMCRKTDESWAYFFEGQHLRNASPAKYVSNASKITSKNSFRIAQESKGQAGPVVSQDSIGAKFHHHSMYRCYIHGRIHLRCGTSKFSLDRVRKIDIYSQVIPVLPFSLRDRIGVPQDHG